ESSTCSSYCVAPVTASQRTSKKRLDAACETSTSYGDPLWYPLDGTRSSGAINITPPQPSAVSQTSPLVQRVSSPSAKHTPCAQRGTTHAIVDAGQSESAVHAAPHGGCPGSPHDGSTHIPPRHASAVGFPAVGHITPAQSRVTSTVTMLAPCTSTC